MIRGIIFDYNRTLFDPEKWDLIEEVPGLLEKLFKNYKLCLITTGEGHRLEKLEGLDLDKKFTKIIVVQGEHKDKKHFLECAKAMDLEPENVLVIGDKVRAEIKAGNNAGMKTVWFKFGKYAKTPPQEKEQEPTYTITKLDELYSVLEKEK